MNNQQLNICDYYYCKDCIISCSLCNNYYCKYCCDDEYCDNCSNIIFKLNIINLNILIIIFCYYCFDDIKKYLFQNNFQQSIN